MTIDQLLNLIQHTDLATFVREGDWGFPLAECLHVLSIATVFGSILMMDLRLVGLASRDSAVTRPARARLFAVASLLLWVGIILCGRLIAYT